MCNLSFWVDWKYGISKMASKITSFISIAYYINFGGREGGYALTQGAHFWQRPFPHPYTQYMSRRAISEQLFAIWLMLVHRHTLSYHREGVSLHYVCILKDQSHRKSPGQDLSRFSIFANFFPFKSYIDLKSGGEQLLLCTLRLEPFHNHNSI